MDHSFLEDEDFNSQVQIAWDQFQHYFAPLDLRIRWDKVWKTVRRLFAAEKRHRKLGIEAGSSAQRELQRISALLSVQHDPDLVKQLISLGRGS